MQANPGICLISVPMHCRKLVDKGVGHFHLKIDGNAARRKIGDIRRRPGRIIHGVLESFFFYCVVRRLS